MFVCDLERRFLPALKAAAAKIATDFPSIRVATYSQPGGQLTDRPGHNFGLSCNFSNAPRDQPDEVVLEICVGGVISGQPTIEVDVVWGHPGQLEADLFPGSVAMTEQTLDSIDSDLPMLIDVLRRAVERGRPEG